ncbi:MAG: transposase [Paracoccaceae bacterium]
MRTGSDGRLRYSPDQRQALLDAFDRSGMSAMSFSREHGVHYQTYIAWIRKRRQKSSPSEIEGPGFAEVLLNGREPAPPTGGLRIVLPCGAMLEVGSRAALPLAVELLNTLRRPC